MLTWKLLMEGCEAVFVSDYIYLIYVQLTNVHTSFLDKSQD